ncbi:MAG: biopolymer transporter ExbD, partial [Lentisphaeria bacterium]|nr:biopolymer transporter ExbD [Lentisphaeria bacterium]
MNLPTDKSILARRIRPRLKPIHGAPDLIPFVNVFFLLLVFFMIGSSFVPISGIPVNLPEAPSVSKYSARKYIITLDRNGRIFFNDEMVDNLKQLRGKLRAFVARNADDERDSVVLRADRSNNFETISQIMALAEELHLNMFILARKSSSEKTVFTETERP